MGRIIFSLLFFSIISVNAQSSWKKVVSKNTTSQKKLISSKVSPNEFDLYTLETENFKVDIQSKKTISLPNSEGGYSNFYIKESSNFTQDIATKYGTIKSYTIHGIDDKTTSGKISIGLDGVHVIVFSAKESTLFIDPYTEDLSTYIVYNKSELDKLDDDFQCLVEDQEIALQSKQEITSSNKTSNDGNLRTYRLALACTGEYAEFHINRAGLSDIDTDATKKTAVLSAMNTTMARVNGIFERDLGVKMEIVVNNSGENELIFLDPDTDNLSNNDANSLIDESQTVCDDIIGTNNYDVGHTFSTGAGGLAYLGALCDTSLKAGGVTGSTFPVGDSYDIDYVAHELGHQFGATHTFNASSGACGGGNRYEITAVEPGGGSTIMAYAGICGNSDNVQNNSDDYFHAVSIEQMWNTIQTTSCGVTTNTGNNIPTVNAGQDFSVPKSTPLKLKGEASDIDGDELTYCWEQTNNEIIVMPLSTNIAGPAFRSFSPTTSSYRYLPSLPTVVAGSTENDWEVIPSVARTMNFTLTVRDNNATSGSFAMDEMVIDVIDTDPFEVTSQTTRIEWEAGTTETITWNHTSTSEAPISCENVSIKLSTDGGETFSVTLVDSTPNDGSYDVTVPYELTSEARIMIEAVDNIFFNVNSTNFSIISTEPNFILTNNSEAQEVCPDATSITYEIDVNYVNDFTETVEYTIEGLPNDVLAQLSNTSTTGDDNLILTISDFQNTSSGTYTIKLIGTSTSITNTIELPTLTISAQNILAPSLSFPENSDSTITLHSLMLEWINSDENILLFDLELATDNSFNNMIINETDLTEVTYEINGALLDWNTTYYWRVKSKNSCFDSDYSETFSFSTTDGFYCTSNFTGNGGELISNVSIRGIDNDSGVADNTGYQDFTSISTSLSLSGTYTLSVTVDPVGFQDHCYVFIDWNNDFIFDTETERYDLGNYVEEVSTNSVEINVPVDAYIGDIRMRVILEYFDSSAPYGDGACNIDHNNYEYGETEDYTLNISDSQLSVTGDSVFNNFTLAPNPISAGTNLTIKFDIQNSDENVVVNFFDFSGKLIKSYTFEENESVFYHDQFFIDDLSTGLYILNINNGANSTSKKLIIE